MGTAMVWILSQAPAVVSRCHTVEVVEWSPSTSMLPSGATATVEVSTGGEAASATRNRDRREVEDRTRAGVTGEDHDPTGAA